MCRAGDHHLLPCQVTRRVFHIVSLWLLSNHYHVVLISNLYDWTNIIKINPVDTSKAATYTIVYDVSDAAGNKATEVTRTVIVYAPQDQIITPTPTPTETPPTETPPPLVPTSTDETPSTDTGT